MINWLINAFLELSGYRKKAAVDRIDDRDYEAEKIIKISAGKMPEGVLLWNGHPQDQKDSNECTGFSGGHLSSIMITIVNKELRTVSGHSVWNSQVINGTANEDQGDYIQSTAKVLVKVGFKDARGNKYKFDKFAKVKRENFKKYLKAGYPILTGANTHRVMCDSNWFWKSGSSSGGHAFCIVGYDDNEKCYLCVNSWGRFGIKGSGLFKVKYGEEKYLFTPYLLDGLEQIETK